MKVVVGLGNPGRRYAGTRHNVGFDVMDRLARSPESGPFQQRFRAQVAELVEEPHRVLLVKPETFMNLSGRCVKHLVDFYQLPLPDLLVVCDDMNLPMGKLRVRTRGSHGGHNGLRDIQRHLGTTEYPRLRIGIASPQQQDPVDYVLSRFRPAERRIMDEAIALAAQAAVVWIHQGIEACMNKYNG